MGHSFRQHYWGAFVLDTFAGKHTAIVLQQLYRSFPFRVPNERAHRSKFVLFRRYVIGNNNKNSNNNSNNDKMCWCHVYNLYVSLEHNFLAPRQWNAIRYSKNKTWRLYDVGTYYVSCVLEYCDRMINHRIGTKNYDAVRAQQVKYLTSCKFKNSILRSEILEIVYLIV